MHQYLANEKMYKDADLSPVEIELIKYKIENAPATAKVWLLYLPNTSNNQLEIMEAKYLKQKYYETHFLTVVGMARTKEKAMQLLELIWNDAVLHTKEADARKYLMSLMEE